MWERLAYYGMRLVVPIYIMQADEPGGLHFSAAQKGTIVYETGDEIHYQGGSAVV